MRPQSMFVAALVLLVATTALGQGPATVQVAESDEYGSHLTDGNGRPLYLFTTDKPEGADEGQITCTSEACLSAWPLFTTNGDPQAGDQVETSMLGTITHDNGTVVTYNGWPLYYYAQDQGADSPQGQDIESFGGEWYLVQPSGEPVGH